MSVCKIVFWNTRGLNSKIKRSPVFQFLQRQSPHICILQQTHLTGGKTMSLRKPWVGHTYHSTYSNLARGVSILVSKSLPFCLLALEVDPGGRYVIVHANILNFEVVIVGLYLPPPALIPLLYQIVSRIAQFATDNVLSMVPDPGMHRLTQLSSSATELKAWAEVFNFTDNWRWRHPQWRAFTCHSASYKTFSRIDLVYSGGPILSRVRDIIILPRGISYHAPISLMLELSCSPPEGGHPR